MMQRPDSWKCYTMADAYAPRPPLQYVAGSLFPLPSLSIVYGAPGSLKSMLLADLAVCVANGSPWLVPLPNAAGEPIMTMQAPVMWLDFDNGQRRTHERFEALGRARALSVDTPLFYYSMPSPWLDIGDNDAMNDLSERITSRSVRLVVVDNLGLVTGGADENSAEMARAMGQLRRLCEATGAAVIVVHHQRKSNGSTSRKGESLRGHGSIEASLDLGLLVERDEGAEVIMVQGTKVRGADVPPFGAYFSFTHKPSTVDLETARFFGWHTQDTNSNAAIEAAIIDVVTANRPINQRSAVKKVQEIAQSAGEKRIRATLDRLLASRRLTATTGKHNSIQYDIT